MGYSTTSQGDSINYGVNEYVVDSVVDLNDIPVDTVKPGSTAIVINTSEVYMLDTNKQWKQL